MLVTIKQAFPYSFLAFSGTLPIWVEGTAEWGASTQFWRPALLGASMWSGEYCSQSPCLGFSLLSSGGYGVFPHRCLGPEKNMEKYGKASNRTQSLWKEFTMCHWLQTWSRSILYMNLLILRWVTYGGWKHFGWVHVSLSCSFWRMLGGSKFTCSVI